MRVEAFGSRVQCDNDEREVMTFYLGGRVEEALKVALGPVATD